MSDSKFKNGNRGRPTLTAQEVLNIRASWGRGMTQGELSRRYKISVVQIGRICRGESWQNIIGMPSDADIEASARKMLALQESLKERSAAEKMAEAVRIEKEKGIAGDRLLDEFIGEKDGIPPSDYTK